MAELVASGFTLHQVLLAYSTLTGTGVQSEQSQKQVFWFYITATSDNQEADAERVVIFLHFPWAAHSYS